MDFKSQNIESQNLDYFFNKTYMDASDEQKKLIPIGLVHRISKKKSDPSYYLKYYEKLYILDVCFGLKYFNVVCGNDGISVDDFSNILKAEKSLVKNNSILDWMQNSSVFIVGGIQLIKSLNYASHLCLSDIYNLIKDAKVTKNMSSKRVNKKAAISGIVDFLASYEMKIDAVLKDCGLKPSDWNCLLYFYNRERTARDFHSKSFKATYALNSIQLRRSVYKMAELKYIEARGTHKRVIYRITDTGVDRVNKIFDQIIVF